MCTSAVHVVLIHNRVGSQKRYNLAIEINSPHCFDDYIERWKRSSRVSESMVYIFPPPFMF